MRKLFYMMAAVVALTLAACGGKSAPDLKGTPYEGAKFSMTIPEGLKVTSEGDIYMNAGDESGDVRIDATFSDYPCKPDQFETYCQGLTGLLTNQGAKSVDKPAIDGNIMIIKATYETYIEDNFVVYFDDKAGIAGKFKYPVDKAEQYKDMVKSIALSMKKK